ncbi:MAG TPA: polyribonucleotide nucleotidyltransferase, partial [Planctomycetota bacterium]|nr:polyribonucleotide nucleotidyltransferase [Planctomycetota bacterium]
MTFSTYAKVEREIAGRKITLETGQVARQALGSVIVTMGETKVFSAVAQGPARADQDFFPLTVDYREKTEAAGKIPGGFFKREGRPTTKEILTMRLTDRSIRPLFTEGFKDEVQVMSHALCYDGVHNADVLSMIAGFAAVHLSGLPFHGAMGAVRVGHLDGQLVAFPPDDRRKDESRLDLVVAGHKDAICMVEAAAKQLSEAEMIDALEFAHNIIKEIAELSEELCRKAGKPRQTFKAVEADAEIAKTVAGFHKELKAVIFTPGKHERQEAIDAIKKQVVEILTAGITDDKAKAARTKAVQAEFSELITSREREMILQGKRLDGRTNEDIRQITIVPNFVPRQHGSVLFSRGETQALVSVTLGTPD